ncbi:MAG: hypothetical protein AB7O52_05175 [Planctomycetota bacterium]
MRAAVLIAHTLLFAAIGFGSGYSALGRYDPRLPDGISDVRDYAAIVDGSTAERPASHRLYRLLVPYLAKPVRSLALGRIGSWDPTIFALVVVVGLLVGLTAAVLIDTARVAGFERSVGIVAALLLVSSFVTVNYTLVGLVDAAELLALVIAARLLLVERWELLPFLAIAAFAKETSVVFVAAFAGSWWLAAGRPAPKRALPSIAITTVLGLGAPSLCRLHVTGEWEWPWQIAAGLEARTSFATELVRAFGDHALVLAFGVIVPLAIPRLARMPRAWAVSAIVTALTAAMLGAWNSAGGNIARPMFMIGGPLLCLSAAYWWVTDSAGANDDGGL